MFKHFIQLCRAIFIENVIFRVLFSRFAVDQPAKKIKVRYIFLKVYRETHWISKSSQYEAYGTQTAERLC